MPITRPFLLYLRSRFHLALVLSAAGLVVLSAVFLRPRIVLPIVVITVAYAVLAGTLFFSRKGAREIVAESDEDRLKKVREKISRYASLR
jgi:hypothetical protein